jgi:putative endonuclease
MNKNWFVYMLSCADNTLYTGVTTDPRKRLDTHNAGKTGAKYTKARLPVELVYTESGFTRGEALKREAAIKKLSRTAKVQLISGVDK